MTGWNFPRGSDEVEFSTGEFTGHIVRYCSKQLSKLLWKSKCFVFHLIWKRKCLGWMAHLYIPSQHFDHNFLSYFRNRITYTETRYLKRFPGWDVKTVKRHLLFFQKRWRKYCVCFSTSLNLKELHFPSVEIYFFMGRDLWHFLYLALNTKKMVLSKQKGFYCSLFKKEMLCCYFKFKSL